MPDACVIAGASGAIGGAVAAELLTEGRAVVGVDSAEAVVSHASYLHVRGDVPTIGLARQDESWFYQ